MLCAIVIFVLNVILTPCHAQEQPEQKAPPETPGVALTANWRLAYEYTRKGASSMLGRIGRPNEAELEHQGLALLSMGGLEALRAIRVTEKPDHAQLAVFRSCMLGIRVVCAQRASDALAAHTGRRLVPGDLPAHFVDMQSEGALCIDTAVFEPRPILYFGDRPLDAPDSETMSVPDGISAPSIDELWQRTLYAYQMGTKMRQAFGRVSDAADEAELAGRKFDPVAALTDLLDQTGEHVWRPVVTSLEPCWARAVEQPSAELRDWQVLDIASLVARTWPTALLMSELMDDYPEAPFRAMLEATGARFED